MERVQAMLSGGRIRDAYASWCSEETSSTPDFNVYHSSTQLSNGRLGLLVDPGAWTNLVGIKWALEMGKRAMKAGHRPVQRRMDRPPKIHGVGEGSNRAEWEVTLPIAISEADGRAHLHQYQAPTVDGAGSELPALLGLQTMSRERGVLEMTDGEEYLTFPGPGGYTIEWAPGARRFKLERPPSGHLILPCDAFTGASEPQGGVATPSIAFHNTSFTSRGGILSGAAQANVGPRPAPAEAVQETFQAAVPAEAETQ